MRYLATVGTKTLWGVQQLHLHCKEVNKFSWERTQGETRIELSHNFQPGTLVIAHITVANNRLQRLDAAIDPIVATLHEFTNIGRRYKSLAREIEAWKESMALQLEELRRREEDLMLRAQDLQVEMTCSLDPVASKLAIPVFFEDHESSGSVLDL
ncbi:hypothetical protein FM036_38475 [Nostoc sp. HG1]|nr:hypothetical protein [Nostoc sp. HG1]